MMIMATKTKTKTKMVTCRKTHFQPRESWFISVNKPSEEAMIQMPKKVIRWRKVLQRIKVTTTTTTTRRCRPRRKRGKPPLEYCGMSRTKPNEWYSTSEGRNCYAALCAVCNAHSLVVVVTISIHRRMMMTMMMMIDAFYLTWQTV